jgi:small-conductance mechanosensitive channel
MLLAQSSDQLDQLEQALAGSQVTGWDVVAALVVLVGSFPVGSLVKRLVMRGLRSVPNMTDEIARLAGRVSQWLVILIAVAWSLSLIGVQVGWVVIVIGVVIIIGVLMVRPMVENSAAGLLLTTRTVFNEGDQIETAGYRGTVTAIGTRTTELETTDGRQIHIPNTEVLKQPIIVYTAFDSRKAAFDITVAYNTDLDRATELLLKAISGVDQVQQDPAPAVQASAFASNAITLNVSFWYPSTMTSDGTATDGAIRACTKALVAADIELATPTIDIENGSPTTANHSNDPGEAPASA